MDPGTAAKIAMRLKALKDRIFGNDNDGGHNTIGVILGIIIFVMIIAFPVFCIKHPIMALKIAAASNDISINGDYLGCIAGKYETPDSDPSYISSGSGDHGGVSYGIPQFPTNGGMANRFVSWLKGQNEELGSLFDGTSAGTESFNSAWKQAANMNAELFGALQITYSHQIDVVPLVEKTLEELEIDLNRSRALQELAISIGQQYGPGTSVIKNSGVTADMSDEEIVKRIYQYKRDSVDKYFSSSSSSVRNSLRNHRFVDEEQDVLNMLGQPPKGVIGGDEENGVLNVDIDVTGLHKDSGYDLLKDFISKWILSGSTIVENSGAGELAANSGEPYTGSGVPLFLQGSYADVSYGSHGTIASSGCGPTSMAMISTYLTGFVTTPIDTASWSVAHGYRASSGTSWGFFSAYAQTAGFQCANVSYSENNIISVLQSGKVMITSMKPGHFTKGGHFIVLRGITADGKILVNDPASEVRTNQEWDVSIVAKETKQAWAFWK